MNLVQINEEIAEYLDKLGEDDDGEHLWSRYEWVTGILVRLSQIRHEIAYQELIGTATPQMKKYRTTILTPIIERFEKVAQYESRKITARHIEFQMERD